MGLPTSRERTYSAGSSPVRAADLNKIQDAIIGGWFGSRPFYVDASKFVNTSGSAAYNGSDLAISTGVAHAGLDLPTNAVVESVEFFYKRTSGTVTIGMFQRTSNPVYQVSVATRDDASSSGNTSLLLDATHVDIGSMPKTGGPFCITVQGGVVGVTWAKVIARYAG